MEGKDKGEIEDLNERLNSRTRYKDPVSKRTALPNERVEVREDWQSPTLDELLEHERETMEAHPIIKKIFIGALMFFVITIGVAGYVFLGGANFISSKNVDIEIVGPTTSSAGEVLELGLTVLNRNNADLEVANLTITYPEGTRDPRDTSKTLSFFKEELGAIRAGREASLTNSLVLFGSAGEIREIKFSVEYKVAGSNATFYKEKVYEITIGDALLGLAVASPTVVNSGDTFTTTITLELNTNAPIQNLMLRAEYPYGYTVSSSSPTPISEDNIWSLGTITPGVKKEVEIRGALLGEHEEERTFRFYVGVGEEGSRNPNLDTVISSIQNFVTIARPSVGLSTLFNGDDTGTYVAPPDTPIDIVVRYQNNLSLQITNPRLEVRLSGSALDKSSVSVQGGGFYDSRTNTIVWQGQNVFSDLAPGDRGQVSFSLSSVSDLPPSSSNRQIGVDTSFSGVTLGSGANVSVSDKNTIQFSSQVNFNSHAIYSRGPFSNTGPIPPQAGQETTYTIHFSLGNTQSEIEDAEVRAYLGQNVEWRNAYSEGSEEISYDAASNSVVWNVETLLSGTGFSLPPREVDFQVALTPGLSQVGTTPVLVSGVTFTGRDDVTETEVASTNPEITTRLPNDPAFIQGDDIVVK